MPPRCDGRAEGRSSAQGSHRAQEQRDVQARIPELPAQSPPQARTALRDGDEITTDDINGIRLVEFSIGLVLLAVALAWVTDGRRAYWLVVVLGVVLFLDGVCNLTR